MQIIENAVMDDKEKENEIKKHTDAKNNTEDVIIINVTSKAIAKFERIRNFYKGEVNDGSF